MPNVMQCRFFPLPQERHYQENALISFREVLLFFVFLRFLTVELEKKSLMITLENDLNVFWI